MGQQRQLTDSWLAWSAPLAHTDTSLCKQVLEGVERSGTLTACGRQVVRAVRE